MFCACTKAFAHCLYFEQMHIFIHTCQRVKTCADNKIVSSLYPAHKKLLPYLHKTRTANIPSLLLSRTFHHQAKPSWPSILASPSFDQDRLCFWLSYVTA